LEYLVRLAHASDRNLVDAGSVRAAIGRSYFWHGDLANAVAEEVRRQVATCGSPAELPTWVGAVATVNTLVEYAPNTVSLPAGGDQKAQSVGV
jgi:hypothetical protein